MEPPQTVSRSGQGFHQTMWWTVPAGVTLVGAVAHAQLLLNQLKKQQHLSVATLEQLSVKDDIAFQTTCIPDFRIQVFGSKALT